METTKSNRSLSICLRDSAIALHLRHTTECVLQRVLCHRFCYHTRMASKGLQLVYPYHTLFFRNVNHINTNVRKIPKRFQKNGTAKQSHLQIILLFFLQIVQALLLRHGHKPSARRR